MAGVTDRRTIYRAEARRRQRRARPVLLLALVIVLAAAAIAGVLLLGGAGGDRAAAEVAGSAATFPASPSAAPTLLDELAVIEVRQGEKATVRYRIVEAPGPVAVTLLVTDATGAPVKTRRLAGAAEPAKRLEAVVYIDLEPGSYTYELRLDEGGSPAASGAIPGDHGTGGSAAGARTSDSVNGSAGGAAASAELRVLPPLPPAFPEAKAVAAAEAWIAGRDGDVAFAVVDTRGRAAGGCRPHRPFQLASLAKAILLVAALRKDPTPDAATAATLARMITESDNDAAHAVFARVGAAGMRAVAETAGLEDYVQGEGWVDTRDSAADQATLFWRFEELVPARGRRLARELLAGVVPIQRWGIPAAAGPEGWRSFFKAGWLGKDNKLMVQAAWLEKGKKRWALAVMSDENPTRSYGWDTQKGLTGLLLGREPTPAYLSVVLE